MIGSPQEPVVEESRETIDAQMAALDAGTIPVVMLPIGSSYNPAITNPGLRVIAMRDCPGAGTYIFNPKQVKVATLLSMVKAGMHHELLGHVQSKAEIGNRPWVVISARRSDGVTLQDSIVLNHPDWIKLQADSFEARFPGCNVVYGDQAPRILEDRTASREPVNVLQAFRQDEYRIGNFQAIGYLRTRTDVFPEGYLGELYKQMKTGLSGKRGDSWLRTLFCGMQDVSYDAIVSYLAGRQLVIMGEWVDGKFEAAGFIFPTVSLGGGDQKAAFAGYGFFRKWWGTDDSEILAMLGLSFFFVELGLSCIHGMRYPDNGLTKNFLEPFGFKDVGRLPRYMLRNGKLVDGVASSLLREDFEGYVERKLVEEYEMAEHPNGDNLQSNKPA